MACSLLTLKKRLSCYHCKNRTLLTKGGTTSLVSMYLEDLCMPHPSSGSIELQLTIMVLIPQTKPKAFDLVAKYCSLSSSDVEE